MRNEHETEADTDWYIPAYLHGVLAFQVFKSDPSRCLCFLQDGGDAGVAIQKVDRCISIEVEHSVIAKPATRNLC